MPASVPCPLACHARRASPPAAVVLLTLLSAVTVLGGKPCSGADLPHDAPLHIKVISKPDKCRRQSANNDKLSMWVHTGAFATAPWTGLFATLLAATLLTPSTLCG